MTETIKKVVAESLKTLWNIEQDAEGIQLQTTKKEFEGNLTLVTFNWVKQARIKPQDLATALGEALVKALPDVVARYNVVGGYLNLVLNEAAWTERLMAMHNDPAWGCKAVTDESPLVMIEYSSPNTNKPLHLGHVRNNLLGGALARILTAAGNRVVKTNIVNDRGIHICKSMLAWMKWGNGATPESTGQKGDHLIGDYYVAFDKHYREELKSLMATYDDSLDEDAKKAKAEAESPLMQEAREMLVKWEQNDPEVRALWAKMNSWVYAGFDETYKALGVSFDKIYYESDTYLVGKQTVLDGLERGLFERHEDGSVWADLTQNGLDQKLLLRKDGTSVYMTQDIGTAQLRYKDYPIDRMIYVVGNEQEYHFQVLSILLDRLGFKWGKDLVHFSYGMVELPNGKMKSREGTVVDADDLVAGMIADARAMSADKVNKLDDISEEEANEIARRVGLGALKYFILKVDARKNMLFNPEESIDFNGNTGPFIQYTYARIRSILRKAAAPTPTLPEGRATEMEATNGADTNGAATVTLPSGRAGEGASGAVPNEKEVSLIQKVAALPKVVQQAATSFNPAGVAQYAYELAKEFNQYYHDYSILREEDANVRQLRLVLCDTIARTIATALGLLGIEVPERM